MIKIKNSKLLICSIVAGVLFACNVVLGRAVYAENSIAGLWTSGKDVVITILQLLLYTILGAGVSFLIWHFIDFLKRKSTKNYKQWKFLKSRYVFWGCWLTTFLAWLPGFRNQVPD